MKFNERSLKKQLGDVIPYSIDDSMHLTGYIAASHPMDALGILADHI